MWAIVFKQFIKRPPTHGLQHFPGSENIKEDAYGFNMYRKELRAIKIEKKKKCVNERS